MSNCSKCNKTASTCGCAPMDYVPGESERLAWCNQACPEDKLNPNAGSGCTLCNLDITNNYFFVDRKEGYVGRCLLDEMTFEQLKKFISSNPCAEEHLYRITDDPCVLQIANQSALKKPTCEQTTELQNRINANTIPIYTLFKGSGMGKGF